MYPHPWPKSQFSQYLNTWRGKDKVSSLFTPHTPKGPWTSSHYRKEPTYYFKLLLCINDSKALQTASEWHVWFVCACSLQLKGSSCSWSPNRWSTVRWEINQKNVKKTTSSWNSKKCYLKHQIPPNRGKA